MMRDPWVRLAIFMYVLNVTFWVVLLCMQGCYLEHEAEPCAADGGNDSGVMPMAGTQAVNLLRSRDGGSNPPTPTTCAGPLVQGECYRNVHDWVSQHGEK